MKKILVLFGVLLLLVGCTGTPVPATPTDTPVFEPSAIPSAVAKDKVENYVHAQICSGAMTLAEGQAIFLQGQWTQYASVAVQMVFPEDSASNPDAGN